MLASNHAGSFDPIIFSAALHSQGIDARILVAGVRFGGPLGTLLAKAQHIPVGPPSPTVGRPAFATACEALREGSVVGVYPEGRISLDPDLWPERGRTGVARMALEAGVPVVPLAHWGSHEVLPAMLNHARRQLSRREVLARYARNVVRRPAVRAKFGPPMYFPGYAADDPAHVQVVTAAIMAGIHHELLDLRGQAGEVEQVNRPDPNRLISHDRVFRFAGAPRLERGDRGMST